MLHIEYRVLCSISFAHTYYKSGRSSDFVVVPTQVCSEALERHGLIIRTTADQTVILQKMDGLMPETPLDAAVCFTFFVYLRNPLLWNVSQLSWEVNPGQMVSAKQFYLTNLNEADGQLIPRLTKNAQLSEKDAMPQVSLQSFNVDLTAGQQDKVIVEQLVPTDRWVELKPFPVKPAQEMVAIKLTNPGLFRLPAALAGAGRPPFFANDEVVRSDPFFGVIDLYLDTTINPGQEYITYIQHRKFGWRYILVDIKSKKVPYGTPADIGISFKRHSSDVDSPQLVKFARLTDDQMGEKLKETVRRLKESNKDSVEDIFVFGSNVAIPILEHRPATIELNIKGVNNFANLPVPDISTLNIRGDNSLIYFNI